MESTRRTAYIAKHILNYLVSHNFVVYHVINFLLLFRQRYSRSGYGNGFKAITLLLDLRN